MIIAFIYIIICSLSFTYSGLLGWVGQERARERVQEGAARRQGVDGFESDREWGSILSGPLACM